jgi:hypothetical protein
MEPRRRLLSRKPAEDKRGTWITFRVNDEESKLINDAADPWTVPAGFPRSASLWVRHVVLKAAQEAQAARNQSSDTEDK